MDDIMFSYHGANGPESNTTLRLEEVPVAVPVERQTTTVFGRVYHNAAPDVKSDMYNCFMSAK